ncbi:MAG TPA: aldo/keto reductase [Spirochaetia bacterium]|jgi:aryl-alcohol dehydrogenase-like predicted oxidoreductase|nr:aldo/keto reductase [Spirochaetia bacterium]
MRFKDFHGLQISRFGLGTVQFGLNYGINNKTGQVGYDEVFAILSSARERGITFVDTSRFYGTSEEVLGKAIHQLHAEDFFVVCTKLDLEKGYESRSDGELCAEAEECLTKSLDALQLESIPLYLLHTEDYLSKDSVWEFVKEQKRTGRVRHIGVSVAVGPAGARLCLAHPEIEALQIAYNALDGRWQKEGILAEVEQRGILLINRSSYLQGLLLMERKDLPPNLAYGWEYLKRLSRFSEESGIPLKELALRYVFSIDTIASTIIGIDSRAQFDENYAIYEKGKLPEDLTHAIANAFTDTPEHLVNPALWGRPFP